jgi:hypothetical protein
MIRRARYAGAIVLVPVVLSVGCPSGVGPFTKGCQSAGDCDDQNPCTDDSCDKGTGTCTHQPKPNGVSCFPGSTVTCDAMGNCQPCATDQDCGAPGPCTTLGCISQVCTVANQSMGTTCPMMMGGSMGVCDGMGTCVECLSDSDCTDPHKPDCVSKECMSKGPGEPCDDPIQCSTMLCQGGFCCSGTCSDQGAASCGTNGTCASGTGACQKYPAGTMCSSMSCSGSTLTTYDKCDGNGNCSQGGTTGLCPEHRSCTTNSTSCNMTCVKGDMNCAPGYACDAIGACKLTDGATCNANDMCASGFCGTNGNGNCCTISCVTTTGVCAATSCSSSGVCVYPMDNLCPNGNAMPSCVTPATGPGMYTPNTCDGHGTCNNQPTPCNFDVTCASSTACHTGCGLAGAPNNNCPLGYYCDGINPGQCHPEKAKGGPCMFSYECVSTVCTNSQCM